MFSKILLILGLLALTLALRTVRHSLAYKLSALGIAACSFLSGYFLTGLWPVGLLCAASWLLLPWVELLTRIRTLTLPMERLLRHKSPPGSGAFPALYELTEEIEAEQFEHVDDSGWDWNEYQQFFRLFFKADERMQAPVCMIDQQEVAFYYVALSSRAKDGTLWTTWNYPFSYSLKLAPQWRVNRCRSDVPFLELLASHREFLLQHGITPELLAELGPGEMQLGIQADLQSQIAHNLAAGVLVKENETEVRYTWRGLFFLWFQFLRDLVRLS